MSKNQATQVVEKEKVTALALPEELQQAILDGQGTIKDDFRSGDFQLPFLTVLQKLSPQVDAEKGEYIENARPGMFFNTVTGDIYDALCSAVSKAKGIDVLVAVHETAFVEWKPDRGGFVCKHDVSSPVIATARATNPDKPMAVFLPNGNQLVETVYFYLLILTEEGPQWAVLALSSTGLKDARKWSTAIASKKVKVTKDGKDISVELPIYMQRYQLTVVSKKNEKGSWYGLAFDFLGTEVSTENRESAKQYRDAIKAGAIRATAPPAESSGDGTEPTKEVPF